MWILCNFMQLTDCSNRQGRELLTTQTPLLWKCSPTALLTWTTGSVVIQRSGNPVILQFLSRQRLKVLKYRSAIRYGFLLTLVTVHKSSKANTYIGVNCTELCMLICMLFWFEKRYKYSHKRAIVNLLEFPCMW